jgi:hypothetical protein
MRTDIKNTYKNVVSVNYVKIPVKKHGNLSKQDINQDPWHTIYVNIL